MSVYTDDFDLVLRTRFGECKRCHIPGIHGVKRSKEDLCTQCEIELFPKRFFPCVFCRKAWQYQMSCNSCELGMQKHIERTHGCAPCCPGREHEIFKKYMEWGRHAAKLTIAGDHTFQQFGADSFHGFFMGYKHGKPVFKKLPYLPKVIEGGICIEEPWYLPEWLTVADLEKNAQKWTQQDEDKGNPSFDDLMKSYEHIDKQRAPKLPPTAAVPKTKQQKNREKKARQKANRAARRNS